MGQIQKDKILKNRIKHTQKRIKERHGLYLDDFQYFELIDQIVEGRSRFITRFSSRRTLHKVKFGSDWIPVVYSNKHQIIITAYQNKWIRKNPQGKIFLVNYSNKQKKPKKKRIHWKLRNKIDKAVLDDMGINN